MRIDREALAEVDRIIEMMSEENAAKIPDEVKAFLKAKKSTTYMPDIKVDIPLYQQTLKADTRVMCSLLYRKYLCTPEEKKRLEKHDEEVLAQKVQFYEFNKAVDKNNLHTETKVEGGKSEENNGLVKYNKNTWEKMIKKFFNSFR